MPIITDKYHDYLFDGADVFYPGSYETTGGMTFSVGDDGVAIGGFVEGVTVPAPQAPPAYTKPELPAAPTTIPEGVPQDGFLYGLGTGAKGLVNGLVRAGAGAVSLGFWNVHGPFSYTNADLMYGAELSQGISEVSGSIAVGLATGGAGCVGGRIGQASKVYDMASNAVDASRGVADMYTNGITVSNAVQTAAGIGGAAANNLSNCFTAGTQIVVGITYDENDCSVYAATNIEDIEVGDLVYSYDTITGEVSQKVVTDTFVRTSNHINYLTIVDENGNEQVIETTNAHPFWVVTNNPDLSRAAGEYVDENGTILYHENLPVTENGYWVEAKDLREGDIFLGANGELATLVNKEQVEFPEGIIVYNFTVDGNHDYFVIAETAEFGQTCILVHNAGIWYHGTDADSANDILTNGLNHDSMKVAGIIGEDSKGFYVTDMKEMAKSFADLRKEGKPGKIIEFSDNDIGDILIGDGTKLHEAVIPFESFDLVKPYMIKESK